jgi:cell division protein FtsW (lipid II flippase)
MGGTSLWATCISLGIILSVSRYAEQAEIEKKELEIIEMQANESNH